ncbi:MAG: TetR/AcrR family transcriptional regulator [Saprospiraceae bacterium]
MTKKESILSAALKLLSAQGLHATPMSAIAKEAGTGMGTIYNYFPNKEVLINALYVKIKEEEKHIFTNFDPTKPLKPQFAAYYHSAIQFFVDHPAYFQFMEQVQASPMITDASRAVGYEAIDTVLVLIEKGKADQVIKRIATQELLLFIGGTIVAYLRLHFRENAKSTTALNNQLKMVWDAIQRS